jgi:hypothetical protein
MFLLESVLGQDSVTIIAGGALILGVLVFGWFDYRRTSRLPPLGTVLVKNRLNSSGRFPNQRG